MMRHFRHPATASTEYCRHGTRSDHVMACATGSSGGRRRNVGMPPSTGGLWGRHERIGETAVYVLLSTAATSPFWSIEPWRELARGLCWETPQEWARARGYPCGVAQMPPRFAISLRAIPMTGTFR